MWASFAFKMTRGAPGLTFFVGGKKCMLVVVGASGRHVFDILVGRYTLKTSSPSCLLFYRVCMYKLEGNVFKRNVFMWWLIVQEDINLNDLGDTVSRHSFKFCETMLRILGNLVDPAGFCQSFSTDRCFKV